VVTSPSDLRTHGALLSDDQFFAAAHKHFLVGTGKPVDKSVNQSWSDTLVTRNAPEPSCPVLALETLPEPGAARC
jgi:hypothetical protein